MKAEGITPDVVIHTDPQNLKKRSLDANKKDAYKDYSLHDHWINKKDLEGVSFFVTSSSGSPDNFDAPVKEFLWMSPGMRIVEFQPIELHD